MVMAPKSSAEVDADFMVDPFLGVSFTFEPNLGQSSAISLKLWNCYGKPGDFPTQRLHLKWGLSRTGAAWMALRPSRFLGEIASFDP